MEMELKDFVSETIQQIVAGVRAAQEAVAPQGARVNPGLDQTGDEYVKLGLVSVNAQRTAQLVQFDLAVSTTSGTQTKGGVGVFVIPFTLGSSGQSTAEQYSSSRIKFAVPVLLPDGDVWKVPYTVR
jgi:hypothetical protein